MIVLPKVGHDNYLRNGRGRMAIPKMRLKKRGPIQQQPPEGSAPVPVTIWKPAYHKMQDVGDIVEFLKEMGLQCQTIGDVTLSDIGRDPNWWVESE